MSRGAFLKDGNVLQVRIPMPPQLAPKGQSGATKYHGQVASDYDAKREDSEKWQREQSIVTEWLTQLHDAGATSVVDVPVGTGRFLSLYQELGFSCLGLDISSDMLLEASAKIDRDKEPVPYLRIGDARDLGEIGQYDVAICCRLMRWLETNEMQLKVISELMRVARRAVIFNVRTETGPLPLPFTEITKACGRDWRWKAERIIEDFTMFMLERQDEAATLVCEPSAANADTPRLAAG